MIASPFKQVTDFTWADLHKKTVVVAFHEPQPELLEPGFLQLIQIEGSEITCYDIGRKISSQIEDLQRRLDIATEALQCISDKGCYHCSGEAREALTKIEADR